MDPRPALLPCLLLALSAHAAEVKDEVCWQNPTENVDGSSLTDLVAVKLYFGPGPRDYRHERQIEQTEPGARACFRIRYQLPPGTWWVAATALDSEGNESGYSNEISLLVPDRTPGRAVLHDEP